MPTLGLNVRGGGGIFSNFMIALKNATMYPSVESFYFDATIKGVIGNPFRFVLDQKSTKDVKDIRNTDVEWSGGILDDSKKIESLRRVIERLEIKKEIIDKVDNLSKDLRITEETLGVHIRLCDMNIFHKKQHGTLRYEDFFKEIEKNVNNKKNIFVASDNDESIAKLKKEFGDMICCAPDISRAKRETENTLYWQKKNLTNPFLWEEAFIDMLLLAKCKYKIFRVSNVAYSSVLFSKYQNGEYNIKIEGKNEF